MKKKVAVIGLGYVGLPSVINHSGNGHQVTGFDIDQRKVDLLNQGTSHINTVANETVQSLLEQGVVFTAEEQLLTHKDVYIIDVPTPIDDEKTPDLSYIKAAISMLEDKVKKGTLIVLESTTYPGTTEEYLVNRFTSLGYEIGSDLFVAYSPERIDPGNTQSLGAKIPRIVAGYTEHCLEQAKAFFGDHVTPVSDLKTAELAKIYENTFRLVNIALADELQKISDNLAIDAGEVIEAAATKPFGFMKFTPNLGIGGHCIPVDPYYLTWLMSKRGVETPLIEVAGKINDSMLDYYLQKLEEYMTANDKKLTDLTVAVLGITYKKNIADTRMSGVITLMDRLKEVGVSVVAFDDVLHAYDLETEEKIHCLKENYDQLKNFDLVIYAVGHDLYEEKKSLIVENSQLFYDLTTV
jgi:UDP-N-acetyl-D-glucosamine dehydrogenase